MSKSKDAKSKFAEAFASNKVVSTIKSNPVATTVTTGYIVVNKQESWKSL